jgi:hypothetical protein
VTSLTLLLLVDAFRPDYLRDAPYLRRLAERSATGRLREPFGFLPRAAYFGGLTPEESGFTNMLCCDRARSPFSASQWLPREAFRNSRTAAQARAWVDRQARLRTTPFAASYLSCLHIPGELLPHFAPAEVEAPWSPCAGYRSLFHELDDRGLEWTACAWPLSNALDDRSDAGIVEHLRASLGPRHRFAYCHLQELDAAGHQFGPEGAGLRHLVRRTDTLVEGLIESLRARYDDLKVIAFGDHGMVSVTRSIDLRPVLASTRLVAGVDYVYFLDSTMLRLWFLTARSRGALMEAFGTVAGLRLVTGEDKVRHHIAGCSASNAHEIFLADPGVVISPDFFSDNGARPLGMHGYDPDCPDNQGIFIANAVDVEPGDAGVVDATEIYDWTRALLGLVRPRPGRATPKERSRSGRFTQSQLPLADVRVAEQLDTVVSQLQPLVAQAEAIVLTGSFGRGEGGAITTGTAVAAVNDFDVLIVGGPDVSRELAGASAALAARVGLDFLDLVWTDGAWSDMPATMLNVDIRYGSQVIRGAEDVIDRMPTVAAADITMHDALILLINRIGGLLSGVSARILTTAPIDARDRRYLVNQIVKALVAVGDSYLVEWRAYDASYRGRRERFSSLAPGAGVPESIRDVVDQAYRLKVWPEVEELDDPVNALKAAAPVVLGRLRDVAAQVFMKPCVTDRDVAACLRAMNGEWVNVDNTRLLTKPEIAQRVSGNQHAADSIRQAIYAAMPLLLAAMCRPGAQPEDGVAEISSWLGDILRIDEESSWETVRSTVVTVWLAMNH